MKFNEKRFLISTMIFSIIVVMTVIIIAISSLNCSGQTSHYYIGNDYNSVSANITAQHNIEVFNHIDYEDGSIALYANFQDSIQALYSFDVDKKCIFYFVVMPQSHEKSIVDELNRYCYFDPVAGCIDRWVDHHSVVFSVWKIKYPSTGELYIFVMDAKNEKDITDFLDTNINYSY